MADEISTAQYIPLIITGGALTLTGIIIGSALGYLARGGTKKEGQTYDAMGRPKQRNEVSGKAEEIRAGNEPLIVDKNNTQALELAKIEAEKERATRAGELEMLAREAETNERENNQKRAEELEDRAYRDKRRAEDRTYKLQIAERLRGLTSEIKSYLDRRAQPIPTELYNAREAYRRELVEKLQKELADNGTLLDGETEIEESDLNTIIDLVNAKFPVPALPELPSELKDVLKLTGELKEETSEDDEDSEER